MKTTIHEDKHFETKLNLFYKTILYIYMYLFLKKCELKIIEHFSWY